MLFMVVIDVVTELGRMVVFSEALYDCDLDVSCETTVGLWNHFWNWKTFGRESFIFTYQRTEVMLFGCILKDGLLICNADWCGISGL